MASRNENDAKIPKKRENEAQKVYGWSAEHKRVVSSTLLDFPSVLVDLVGQYACHHQHAPFTGRVLAASSQQKGEIVRVIALSNGDFLVVRRHNLSVLSAQPNKKLCKVAQYVLRRMPLSPEFAPLATQTTLRFVQKINDVVAMGEELFAVLQDAVITFVKWTKPSGANKTNLLKNMGELPFLSLEPLQQGIFLQDGRLACATAKDIYVYSTSPSSTSSFSSTSASSSSSSSACSSSAPASASSSSSASSPSSSPSASASSSASSSPPSPRSCSWWDKEVSASRQHVFSAKDSLQLHLFQLSNGLVVCGAETALFFLDPSNLTHPSNPSDPSSPADSTTSSSGPANPANPTENSGISDNSNSQTWKVVKCLGPDTQTYRALFGTATVHDTTIGCAADLGRGFVAVGVMVQAYQSWVPVVRVLSTEEMKQGAKETLVMAELSSMDCLNLADNWVTWPDDSILCREQSIEDGADHSMALSLLPTKDIMATSLDDSEGTRRRWELPPTPMIRFGQAFSFGWMGVDPNTKGHSGCDSRLMVAVSYLGEPAVPQEMLMVLE